MLWVADIWKADQIFGLISSWTVHLIKWPEYTVIGAMFSDCIHVLCLFLTHTVQFQKYHIAFHHFSFCKVSNKSITSQSCSEWKKNILIVLVSFAQASLYSEKCPSCFENCIKSGKNDIPAVRIASNNWEKLSKQAHSALLLLMKQLSPCFSDTPPFQRSPLCYETQTLLCAAGPEEWSPSDLWPLRSWLLKAELFPALGFL